MSDCIFCRIVSGNIPAKVVYQDDHTLAFDDINPQAPVHFLVIPKAEIPSLADSGDDDSALLGHLLSTARMLAEEMRLANGYRVIINCGPDAGQSVDHLHVHVLGGRPMKWPPG